MDISNQYQVEFTDECKREIRKIYNLDPSILYIKKFIGNKIYNYIKEDLYAEEAAQNLMIKIEEFTSNLSYAPRIYAEIDKYKGTDRIYRRMVINSYVILYTIDEENKKVYVSHMYYSGSDYINKI